MIALNTTSILIFDVQKFTEERIKNESESYLLRFPLIMLTFSTSSAVTGLVTRV